MSKEFQKLVVMHKNVNGGVLTAATVAAKYELDSFIRDISADVRPGDFIAFAEAGRRPYEDEEDDGSAADEPEAPVVLHRPMSGEAVEIPLSDARSFGAMPPVDADGPAEVE